jgi:enoyl-CoA hydratase
MMNLETLLVSVSNGVAHIALNRPDKANALNGAMWQDLKTAFHWLAASSARVCVLSAQGKHFTAGIEFEFLMSVQSEIHALSAELKQARLKEIIIDLQAAVSTVASCKIPVIAAIHGACIGAGVDLITACDMRYATQDARFSVKEIDLAIVADLGTLQRLPRLIGDGLARELAYTGREINGDEALAMRLINRNFAEKDRLMQFVFDLASNIAEKSPGAIRGIKDSLNYNHDHSAAEGLEYIAEKNSVNLFSADFTEALTAARQKRPAKFNDPV